TSGLDVLRESRRAHPRTQVIMMTGFGSVDTAVDSMKGGAFEYISKPFKFDEIKLTLRRAIEQLEGESDAGPAAVPDPAAVTLIGHSRAMAEIRSEEHTSELQSLRHLVCRLLLEKKKSLQTDAIRN